MDDRFSHCPDKLVNSSYNVDTNEVVAFEDLIGCRGSLAGYQTQPLLLYPAAWQLEEDELAGTAAVYRQLSNWLNQLAPQEAG